MSEYGLRAIRFYEVEIEIDEFNGQRWATMSSVARALGYADPHQLSRLVDRNADEFTGKQGVVNLATPGGVQNVRMLNYNGVIRAAMKSDAPKAKLFRDWAEGVLFKVMTTGRYETVGSRTDWTDELNASERLRLAELRVNVGLKITESPDNPVYQQLFHEVYGGSRPILTSISNTARGTFPTGAKPRPKRPRLKPIIGKLEKDPEVKMFVEDLLQKETHTYDAIISLAAARFGSHRAPSRNALFRHYRRMRQRESGTIIEGKFNKAK